MEWIDAALTVRRELVDAVCNPAGTITGDDLDAGQLLIAQRPIELLKDGFPVAIRDPDDRVGVMIDNHGDVLMPLAVACLVNSYAARSCRLLEMQFPTVCQSMRMKLATALLGMYSASHATVRSKSLVKLLPG